MSGKEEYFSSLRRAADAGDANAMVAVAWEYIRGELIPVDLAAARDWLERASPVSDRVVRFECAKAYLFMSDPKALALLEADESSGYGPALYLMGVCFQKGCLGDKNSEKALYYYQRAAEMGHIPSAAFKLHLENTGLSKLLVYPKIIYLGLLSVWLKLKDSDDPRIKD